MSFVFFFERGNSGTSWSIRDYSIADPVRVYRPGDFPWPADDILNKARYAVKPATAHLYLNAANMPKLLTA
jgi:hypothetical protein